MVPKLTASGKNLLLRALAGETITFTKIQIGNGAAQDPIDATGLSNPIITVELSKIVVGAEYVTLTSQFSNSSIEGGFHITEAGFFAKDPDDSTKEILYAIGNEDESSADYVPNKNDRILEMQFDAAIFIGDAENVSAAISSSLVYASKDDFDNHTSDKTNPHGVTKEQVGLGNVPNLSPSDQAPTFTEATVLANIESGEKASTLFGKIKLAISKLTDHLNNRNNPHNTTAEQVGAAAKTHTHNTFDITNGILPEYRGGTGCSDLLSLATNMQWALTKVGYTKTVLGEYIGNGNYGVHYKNALYFESKPKMIVVMSANNAAGFITLYGAEKCLFGSGGVTFEWVNNLAVNWVGTTAAVQMNTDGEKYIYFAIL